MDDLEDLVEGFDELEEIGEELLDPEELLEDVAVKPLTVLAALVAVLAGAVTLLAVLALGAVVALQVGLGAVILAVIGGLALLGLLVTVAAVAGFLYFRTDLPRDVREQVEDALRRADDTAPEDAAMSEAEAVDALKERYANGEIDERALERRLDEVFRADRPESVIEAVDRSETVRETARA